MRGLKQRTRDSYSKRNSPSIRPPLRPSPNDHMTPPSPSSETTVRHPSEGMITLAHVIYALHAFSALTGLASSVLVLTAFLTGWPSIIAVILNYAKRSEVRMTWLDSHFGWQIRTRARVCIAPQ